MKDLTCEPKPKNGSAKKFVLIFVASAVALYLVAQAVPYYRGLFHLAALLLLVPAIFVAFKYLLTSYVYTLFSDEGRTPPCLLVEQRQGKRSSLVCRVLLESVVSLSPYTGGPYPGRCYVYTATMRGGSYQLLHAREDGRDIYLLLEADEGFLEALSRAATALEK